MRSRGLNAYDERSLKTALMAITAEKKDSDEDGVADVEELKAGENPNVAAGDDFPPPEYGCAVGSRHGGEERLALGFGILLAAMTRRRSKSRVRGA
jgi:hypothetical protein